MNFKRLVVLIVCTLLFQMIGTVSNINAKEKRPKMIMTYMTSDSLPNSRILFIESTFSAFEEDIVLVPADQMQPSIVEQGDVLVFIGDEKGVIPQALQDSINTFKGRIIAIGQNVEQLSLFENWNFLGQEYINKIDGESLSSSLPIVHTIPPKGSTIISLGENVNDEIPFIIKNGRLSYIATTLFGITEEKYALSRSLYTILEQKPPDVHQAYIRLEDISPISDPKLVEETGNYLADRDIPFYMVVIPVYVNSDTGEKIPMKQNKDLVKVIKKLQSRGGMVIAHGYTHSYRHDETGEGFEFWDVKLNQRIVTDKTDEIPPLLKSRTAFTSEEVYRKYLQKSLDSEKEYIDQKLTKSIEELTELGLFPIAFEAPHYTMSSNGYQTTSQYFSSIFGQIQLSDDNWMEMNNPLFVAKPNILSGMTIYPETIGFIDPSLVNPYQNMEKEINRLQTVPGSVIGGFYHSYLGVDYLPQMIKLIESVPNMEWLDLRKTTQSVQTEFVKITQEPEKQLVVSSNISIVTRMFQRVEGRPFELVLWALTFIVAMFVLVFFTYVLSLRTRLRKRLFEERKKHG